MNKKNLLIPILLITLLLASCAGNDIFPAIETNMSNPITLAIDSANNRLYINNSNYRVLYDDGSLHVVNITDPTNPTRVNYSSVPSFSGAFYLDTTNSYIYTPNRQSDNETDRRDNMFRINIDEASANFLDRSDYASGDDPFGIAYYAGDDRILVVAEQGQIDYYEVANNLSRGTMSLTSTLDTGAELSGDQATRVAVWNTQGLVTRTEAGVWILNLDEIGVSGKYPVDYFIGDISYPRGIAVDANYIYVVSVEIVNNEEKRYLLVLDISTLTPRTDNTTTQYVDKDDDSILVASIDLDDSDPREVALSGTTAYVTHFDNASVSVVDLNTNTKTTEFSVGEEPYGMAVYSPGGVDTHLCVANSGANTVSIVDISNNTVVGTYP